MITAATIGFYGALVSLAGSVAGASEKVSSLWQRLLPPPTKDGILVGVAEKLPEGQERKQAIIAVREVYKTLADAHIHVERERQRQAVSSVIRLLLRTAVLAVLAFMAPLILRSLGVLTQTALVTGGIAILCLSVLVGKTAVRIEGMRLSGRVIANVADIHKRLDQVSMNSLVDRAKNLGVAAENSIRSNAETLTDSGGASALTRTFLEAYDDLANAVNSIELYTLGVAFSSAASNLGGYLAINMHLVVADALESMVNDGLLAAKPIQDPANWLSHQEQQLKAAFKKLGVSRRLEQREYRQLWSQDFVARLSHPDGKKNLLAELHERSRVPFSSTRTE